MNLLDLATNVSILSIVYGPSDTSGIWNKNVNSSFTAYPTSNASPDVGTRNKLQLKAKSTFYTMLHQYWGIKCDKVPSRPPSHPKPHIFYANVGAFIIIIICFYFLFFRKRWTYSLNLDIYCIVVWADAILTKSRNDIFVYHNTFRVLPWIWWIQKFD